MDEVRKIAKLARLELSDAEVKKFSQEIGDVIKAFDALKGAEGEEPSFQPFDVKNVMRADAAGKCLTREEALSNTKNKEKGFFKGPKVIDK